MRLKDHGLRKRLRYSVPAGLSVFLGVHFAFLCWAAAGVNTISDAKQYGTDTLMAVCNTQYDVLEAQTSSMLGPPSPQASRLWAWLRGWG